MCDQRIMNWKMKQDGTRKVSWGKNRDKEKGGESPSKTAEIDGGKRTSQRGKNPPELFGGEDQQVQLEHEGKIKKGEELVERTRDGKM